METFNRYLYAFLLALASIKYWVDQKVRLGFSYHLTEKPEQTFKSTQCFTICASDDGLGDWGEFKPLGTPA